MPMTCMIILKRVTFVLTTVHMRYLSGQIILSAHAIILSFGNVYHFGNIFLPRKGK